MGLTPFLNTDIKMSAKMFEALDMHETVCSVTGVKSVTTESVKAFLAKEHGEKFASTFELKFLLNSPDA
jgi:hypothetical protein